MPNRVRAAVAFEPRQPLRTVEVELADPGPGEVLVRLHATGLCHSDLHILDGNAPHSFPVILGHEGAGDVVAVGTGVTDFFPGDRVIPYLVPDCGQCPFCKSGRTNLCVQFTARRLSGKTPFLLDGKPVASFMGLGTLAQMTVVQADMLIKVNPTARTDHICCVGCGVTTGIGAALISAKVTRDSSVAVFGVGGVGLSVIQGAKIAGASRIIAIDTNPAKAPLALKLGATDFVNPKEVENVVSHIVRMTGLGVDYSFECVGIPALAGQALESTNPAWGLATFIGVMPAGELLTTAPLNLVTGRRWTGSLMGGAKRQDVARFVDLYVAGAYALDELISHRLTHNEINRGFDMMRKGESVRSVVVYDSSSMAA